MSLPPHIHRPHNPQQNDPTYSEPLDKSMLTCEQLTELVTEYTEGKMGFWRSLSFKMHMGMCVKCHTYVNQMRTTVQLVGAVGEVPRKPIPDDIKDTLMDKFRNWPVDS